MARHTTGLEERSGADTEAATTSRALSLSDILDACVRIRGKVLRTPTLTSQSLNARSGGHLHFKCENFQKTGAFKVRGATNLLYSLPDSVTRCGVVTHSSGNHAAGVAYAAMLRSVPAYLVLPGNAPQLKQEAVRRYGGELILCEPTFEAREAAVQAIVKRTGAIAIHPSSDRRIMAGQGTLAVELLEEHPDLDLIVCSVGGGSQISGVAVAAKSIKPSIEIIGVEPSQADDARRSLLAGKLVQCPEPVTIAEGLRAPLSTESFVEIRRHVSGIVTVSEEAIVRATRTIWEVLKIVVELSGATAYAAVAEGLIEVRGRHAAIILSGGNLDLDRLPWSLGTTP